MNRKACPQVLRLLYSCRGTCTSRFQELEAVQTRNKVDLRPSCGTSTSQNRTCKDDDVYTLPHATVGSLRDASSIGTASDRSGHSSGLLDEAQGDTRDVSSLATASVQASAVDFWPSVDTLVWEHGICGVQGLDGRNACGGRQ